MTSILNNNLVVDEALDALKTVFYDRLQGVVIESMNGSKSSFEKNPSIIISIFKMTKNNRVRILNDASLVPPVSRDVLTYLMDHKYVRSTLEFSKYTLTAQGIWEIEKALGYVSVDKLLEYIDSGMESVVGKLTDKEKVIIFTLLSLRAFSQFAPLIRISDVQKEKSAEVMEACADYLHSLGAISVTREKIFKGGNISDSEEPGSKLLRRMDKLPGNTRQIYRSGPGKSYTYWLDLYDKESDSIKMEKLSYLFWKIFGGCLDFEKQQGVVSFCDDILLRYKNYIYEDEIYDKFIFFDSKYANILSDALFNVIEHQEQWEREEGT